MDLSTLKPSISKMNDQYALAIIMQMRNSRHTAKKTPKKKSVSRGMRTTKEQRTRDLIAGLSYNQKKALLKELLES